MLADHDSRWGFGLALSLWNSILIRQGKGISIYSHSEIWFGLIVGKTE